MSAAPRPIVRLAAHQGGPGVVGGPGVGMTSDPGPRGGAPVGDQGPGGRLKWRPPAQDRGASVEVLESDLRNPDNQVKQSLH